MNIRKEFNLNVPNAQSENTHPSPYKDSRYHRAAQSSIDLRDSSVKYGIHKYKASNK